MRASSGTAPSKSRGRPRSEAAKASILAAALNEFEKHGFQNMSLEGIAKEAGVGKPTLYRWWPSKASLILEALTVHTNMEIPVPNTGDTMEDLNRYLTDTCDVLNRRTGRMIRELIGAAQLDDDFARQFWNDFLLVRRQGILGILGRAGQRRELMDNADFEFIADLCYGPIWYRLLNRIGELDRGFVERIVLVIAQSYLGKRGE